MKKLNTIAACLACFLSIQSVHAATDSYTSTKRAPTVYSAGTSNAYYFTVPSSVPNTGTSITTVSWSINPYSNGATSQNYAICYYAPNQNTTPVKCVTIASLSASTSLFSGYSAKGAFSITVQLTGGTYPVYPSQSSSVTVNYQY